MTKNMKKHEKKNNRKYYQVITSPIDNCGENFDSKEKAEEVLKIFLKQGFKDANIIEYNY